MIVIIILSKNYQKMEHTISMLLYFLSISLMLVISLYITSIILKRKLETLNDKNSNEYVEYEKIHKVVYVASIASLW